MKDPDIEDVMDGRGGRRWLCVVDEEEKEDEAMEDKLVAVLFSLRVCSSIFLS